jgi:hypothetical protein
VGKAEVLKAEVLGRARLQPSRYAPYGHRALAPEGPACATVKTSAAELESPSLADLTKICHPDRSIAIGFFNRHAESRELLVRATRNGQKS